MFVNFVFAQDFVDFSNYEDKNNFFNFFYIVDERKEIISFSDFIFPLKDYNQINLIEVVKKREIELKPKWTYKIQKGDSLWSISKKFKVPIDELLIANNLRENSILKAGDKIVIPGIKPQGVIAIQQVREFTGKFVSALKEVGDLIIPVSGFNWGQKHSYNGSDIAAPCGEPVYAASSGTVIESSDGWNSGYGNYIIIKHDGGYYTLYGHLSLRVAEVGQKVNKGQLIGYVGNTGYTLGTTGCHLHFEVRGKTNPLLR